MKKIKLFGYRIVRDEDYERASNNEVDRLNLIVDRDNHKKESILLKTKLDAYELSSKVRRIIPMDTGDPIPEGGDQRKFYVAKVAGLHKDILKPKLKQMISKVHNLLEEESNDHNLDLILKGAVYSFREILIWGDSMVNEQIANQIDDPSLADKGDKK